MSSCSLAAMVGGASPQRRGRAAKEDYFNSCTESAFSTADKMEVNAPVVGRRRHSVTILVQPADGELAAAAGPPGGPCHGQQVRVGPPSRAAGILVHGCHLQADGWEDIVWGHPPRRLGRLPHAVLLAREEGAKVVVLGTGASRAADGRLEGQFTLDFLLERLPRLHEFQSLQRFPLEELQRLTRRAFVAEVESQNTMEEVTAAFRIWSSHGVTRGFLISSPTHLPRCLAFACQAYKEDGSLFSGELHASPSETCYMGFEASDVVVVEPPHRGDRDKALDELPLHSMVRRSFKVPPENKADFHKEFDSLLKRYGV